MKNKLDKIYEMSATERMDFVKECCSKNAEVSKKISCYSDCRLQWIKEIGDYIVFTVLAGTADVGYHEYITVSCNTKTGDVFCLTKYLHSYGGYNIYVTKEGLIRQEIGYGFGSWEYRMLNPDLSVKSTNNKQELGSCCG